MPIRVLLDGPSASQLVHPLEWMAAAVALVVVAGWYARRSGRRALMRFRARVDRFKLANRKSVRARLFADPAIAAAVRNHAATEKLSEASAWKQVGVYVTEIVPFFNVVAYYQIGYRVAEVRA